MSESRLIDNDADTIEVFKDQGYVIHRIPGDPEYVLAIFTVPLED